MSNRVLWILIFIWVIAFGFLVHLYFFVYYTSSLIINSNVPEYEVYLEKISIWKFATYNCKENVCTIKDLAPLEYKLSISKEGYKKVEKYIEIPARNKFEVSIELEKDTLLNKLEKVETDWVEKTVQEKAEDLMNKKKYYSYHNLWENLKFYFELNYEGLILSLGESNLWTFSKVEKDKIFMEKVYGSDYVLLTLWENKYLINTINFTKRKLEITPKISYAKSWIDDNSFIFVTDKWAFIYNYQKDSIEYFYMFKDFVYINEWYIWVIYEWEEKKLKNFWWENKRNNLVIKYNPETKDRDIIYETDLEIDKIIKTDNWISVFTEGDEYKLDNF